MSRLKEREIARRLAEPLDAEPPEGLLDRIKAEIPPVIEVGTKAPGGEVRPFPLPASTPPPRRQRWLIAATLAMAVVGGLLAWQLRFSALPEAEMEEALSQGAAERRADAALPPPPPPAVPPPPPASHPAPSGPEPKADSEADSETAQMNELRDLGYLGPKEELRRQERESPRPSAPAQPVEIPAAEPMGVEGGVEGGVVGGVAGGVVGGEANESFAETIVANEAPLRVGGAPPPAAMKRKVGTTGGDAEPNDEAYGDTFYRSAGVNPFVDTEEDRLSTFGLDVDTASYTVARRYLGDGNLPVPESIRLEEFVNFFHYGDEPPVREDFAIRAEGAPTPFAPEGYRLLRFNIRGREIRPEERKPAVLTFVIDISGSMEMENRLGLVKRSLGLLLGKLRPADKVGLVVYGNQARVVLEPTHDLGRVRAAVNALHTDGATNAEAGLLLGYEVANRYFRPEGNNRILLCSDGVANVGTTGPERILERIGKEARKGIELTTLGFGMGNFNDHLMEQLANKGDGRYAYLDTLEEARRVLVEELEGTLETIAKDSKVQVAFNPEVVDRWRLLGYENRDIADEKFRDDTVDAGEIGAGHSVTALYEVKLKPGAAGGGGDRPVANLHLRWRSERTGRVREEEKMLRLSQLAPSWERATPALRLASVVAEFAEILRGSYWAKGSSLDELFRRSQRISGEWAETRRAQDVAELVSLIGKAARLKGEGE